MHKIYAKIWFNLFTRPPGPTGPIGPIGHKKGATLQRGLL